MRKQPNSRDCFICGVANAAGVRVVFFDSTDETGRAITVARFRGRPRHQGYPGRMHGGIIVGILDETIGRAINAGSAARQQTVWGVAADLQVRFVHPVPLGEDLIARGWVTRDHRRLFDGAGVVLLPDGRVAASAEARYVKLPLEAISDLDPDELGWRIYDDQELESLLES